MFNQVGYHIRIAGGRGGNNRCYTVTGRIIDDGFPATGLSALSAAAAEGHSDTVRLLIRSGKADVNIADLSGRTPIFYAVEQGQTDTLRNLLSLGADVNAKDNNGVTALMRASSKKQQECLNVLLKQKNINVNEKDFQDRTAIVYSVYATDVAPAQALLKAGADINSRDRDNNTPLLALSSAKNALTGAGAAIGSDCILEVAAPENNGVTVL